MLADKGPKSSTIKEIKTVQPNDEQLLIRQKYVGVCKSEHYDWSVAKQGDAFGHEPLRIVEQVGKNVKGFQLGDRVSGMWGSSLPGTGGMVEYALADPQYDTIT